MKNKILAMAAASMLTANAQSQNFAKVYDAMPDMTLDQAYCALIDFQKSNPFFAATYIQLGSTCEKKLIIYDPLREPESVTFWAKNAELFYGNLKVYYTENDCRSEFYENLNIPFSGKRITDADMWNYVSAHRSFCKNYNDTTTLIFKAIESARLNYNLALEHFRSIYVDYSDLNDMLLRYDAKLAKRLSATKAYAQECESQFAEYKRLTKQFPIADYRQIYEKVPIETFRLDGLTNSDFFKNRFYIWDYASWIDKFEQTFNSQIAPLRKDVERINKAFFDGRAEFERGGIVSLPHTRPYDEYFLYKLGHFDVGSVVDPLFDYLDATREMTIMAGDSLGRNVGDDMSLESRKMRRLSRLAQQQALAASKRKHLTESITAGKVARFADFFQSQYKGLNGLRSFLQDEEAYCQGIVDKMSDATADYIRRAAQTVAADTYSTASGAAAPSVPLWVALEPQNVSTKHYSTQIARNANGQIAATAGHLKANAKSWFVASITPEGKTQWLLNLKGVNSVTSIASTSDGVLVSAIRQLKPVIIFADNTGKETSAFASDAEIVNFMDRDGVTGAIFWVAGNDQNTPTLSKLSDGAQTKDWTTTLSGISSVSVVSVVADGFVATGITPQGELATVRVGADGTAGTPKIIAEGVNEIISTQRVSSGEMAALVKLAAGGHKYMPYSIAE